MKDYKTVQPIQQFDNMACWAASVEWLKSFRSDIYTYKNQYDIVGNSKIKNFIYYSEDDGNEKSGGFYPQKSELMFHAEDLHSQNIQTGYLTNQTVNGLLEKRGPVVIIFNDYTVPTDFHANVIIKSYLLNGTYFYNVMEPRTRTFEHRHLNWYRRANSYLGYANSVLTK